MSSITGSMTAASSTACSWLTNNVKVAGNALLAGVAKVSNFVTSFLQACIQQFSIALGRTQSALVAGMNVLKANPQIALGGLVALTLAAAAVYAYKNASV